MIKRINLIQKKPYTFTFLRIVQVGLVLLSFVGVLVGYQVFNASRLQAQIDDKQTLIKTLEEQRDLLMKKPTVEKKKKVSVGEYQELMDRIENVPNWSKLIMEITNNLPNTVWLTSFRSVGGSSAIAAPGKDTKSHRDKDSTEEIIPEETPKISYKLEISGLSSSMKNVTEFASKLGESKYLSDIKAESQQQSFGFSFIIIGNVNSYAK